MLKGFRRSPSSTYLTCAILFLLMLAANLLTPLTSDDYTYCFSFDEGGERIESIGDILPSLMAHGKYMNGRYTAHFFAQLFLLLPSFVFDVVNSLVFVGLIFVIYKIATKESGTNNFLFVFLFGMTWLCQSDFGQVNLWLDGACNYLWALFFGILFVYPYISYVLYGERLKAFLLPPFFVVAFISGSFMENISPAFILVGALSVFASTLILKRKVRYEQIIGIILSLMGFILMMSAPGEWANKATDGTATSLLTTLLVALGVLASLAVPIIVCIILLKRRITLHGWRDAKVLTVCILLIGALASNFALVLAAYYPLRCSAGCTTMLLFALTLLLSDVKVVPSGRLRTLCALLAVAIALSIAVGMTDITRTYVLCKENERTVLEAKERGEGEVAILNIRPYTKYSALYLLKYIDTESPDGWPNASMAKYYEMERIYGYESD